MKRIKYYLLAVVVSLFSLSSCDLFDSKPIDKISQNSIWGNPGLLDTYMLPIYRNMHPGYRTSIMTGFLKIASVNYLGWYTDQLTVGFNNAYTGSTYGDLLKGNNKAWNTYARKSSSTIYTYISSINLLLESEDQIVNDNKSRILAEAHYLRAWYYYRLFRDFGGVMLIDKVLNPLKEDKKYPRASYEEMVNFIVSDAKRAIDGLSETYGSDNIGRVRKGAALMLIAKTYYWAAAERFQNAEKPYLGFSGNRSEEMLNNCAEAYRELFKLKDHELTKIAGTTREEIVKEYRKIFLMKHGKEGIFEFNHNNQGVSEGNNATSNIDAIASTPVDNGTYCAFIPTQNHVDEYRMANGKMINDAESNYNKQDPYKDRDVRFYANVVYDGAKFRNRTIDIRRKWATESNKYVNGKDMTPKTKTSGVSNTGYYMAKLLDESYTFQSETYSKQNCIIWRLAEAYLDYAHVQFLLGKSDVALDYVNRIRERVKEKALESITLADILNERRVELAFEEIIYWDILRSGEAQKVMSGSTNPLYKVIVSEKEGAVTYEYDIVNGNDDKIRYFDKRQLYLPLDWNDIRYHGLDQNPDWIEL